mgnify:CR=1 FL=1
MKISNSGLSIVIPVFNELENIEPLFKKINLFAEKAFFDYEINIIDGNSNDGTADKIEQAILENTYPNIHLIRSEKANGYGGDICLGLTNAKYEFLAWTHADLQTDLNDLIHGYKLMTCSDTQDIILKGRRKSRPLLDQLLTFGMSIYVLIRCGFWIPDINAQPKIFQKTFFEKLISVKKPPNDFSLDLFILLEARIQSLNITSFDVNFSKRQFGEAKGGGGSLGNRIKLIKRTLIYIDETAKKL